MQDRLFRLTALNLKVHSVYSVTINCQLTSPLSSSFCVSTIDERNDAR
jgi:hypothetical protein